MSLAHFQVGCEPVVTEKYLRYTVRVDLAFGARLKALARKRGVSVETLVQSHFETILDEASEFAQPTLAAAPFDPVRFARENGISIAAAGAWQAMTRRAERGQPGVTTRVLAADLGLASDTVRNLIAVLREAHLVIEAGRDREGILYRAVAA